MGELKGFLKYERQEVGHRSVEERVRDFNEIDLPLTPEAIRKQAARCMDCGIPFCHGAGCPVSNSIPDMNEFVYKGQWEQACRILHETNNFPEVTGRICPAPCEMSCTLAVSDHPVLIRHIEYQIVERGFQEGWIRPLVATKKTGRRVAIVGSGPAGLAAAQQLARAGHSVVVFERDERVGGMLRYGIPDFKLGKHILDRRLEQLVAEGVEFQTGVDAGKDISPHYLRKMFDCVCLTMGARQPRDIPVPGRERGNILFAMDYLTAQNKLCAAEALDDIPRITARDKVVVVLAAATPAATAWAPPDASGPRESTNWRSCPSRPNPGPRTPPGRCGRGRCGLPPRTRRGASVGGACRRKPLAATAAPSRSFTPARWNGRMSMAPGNSRSFRGPSLRSEWTSSCWPWVSFTSSTKDW